jgi:hypothetical protein
MGTPCEGATDGQDGQGRAMGRGGPAKGNGTPARWQDFATPPGPNGAGVSSYPPPRVRSLSLSIASRFCASKPIENDVTFLLRFSVWLRYFLPRKGDIAT